MFRFRDFTEYNLWWWQLNHRKKWPVVAVWWAGHFARCKLQKINGVGAFYLSRYDRFMVMDLWSLWCRCRMVYGAGQCAAGCKLQVKPFNWWLALLLLAVSGRGPAAWFIAQFAGTLQQEETVLHWTAGHLLCFSSLSSRKKTIFWNILWNMSGSVKLTNGKAFTGNIFKLSNLHSKRQDGRKYIHIYLML